MATVKKLEVRHPGLAPAPGAHNMTTDIRGADGYAPDDYTQDFNGTSSATPIVAGACALVLSANPALTGTDVARIITSTAEKVGPFPYAAGRNDYFGHGRLDVYEAVKAAIAHRSASEISATAGAGACRVTHSTTPRGAEGAAGQRERPPRR